MVLTLLERCCQTIPACWPMTEPEPCQLVSSNIGEVSESLLILLMCHVCTASWGIHARAVLGQSVRGIFLSYPDQSVSVNLPSKPFQRLGTPRRSTNPLRLAEAAVPTQSDFRGDILKEAIQTAANEYLMRDVVERGGRGGGGRPPLNALL